MADRELSTAPVQVLADGGFLVAMTDASLPDFRKLPVAQVATGIGLAETAIQPTDLGSIAYEDRDGFVSAATHVAVVAGLQAQIDGLAWQIATILAGGGLAESLFFDPQYFDSGEFA
jgi:hypothetical protein